MAPADLERWKSTRERRENERRERIRAAQAKGVDTRRRKTRMRCFLAFMRLAMSWKPTKITAARIAKRARLSEASFFTAFDNGVTDLLFAACERISKLTTKMVNAELQRRAELGDNLDRVDRVSLTVTRMTHLIARYPQLFNVEGIIPREIIYILSDPIASAIVGDDDVEDQYRADATVTALYHATSLVGIMRTGLGEGMSKDDYVNRLTSVMLSQIIPVTLFNFDPEIEERASWALGLKDDDALHISDKRAFERLARWTVDEDRVPQSARLEAEDQSTAGS